jgi:serine phosphatase RsbU (regulator of sigma subunit)/pSer/pThr/pTyr-binding forkhead associated (FHA) protein
MEVRQRESGVLMNLQPKQPAHLALNTDGSKRHVPIDRLPFMMGRGEGCSLVIAHPQVSREHARIESERGNYVIHDENSRHGTFVNGVRITRSILRAGDSITLGSRHSVVVFEDGESDASHTLLAQISQRWTSGADENDLEKLSLFLQAAQSLSSVEASNEVLRTMLEYSIRLTGAERGFVFLGESADSFRLECGRDLDGNELVGEPSLSRSVIRDAAESQVDFILSDIPDEVAAERESIMANAIRSVIAIPLRAQGATSLLGLLYLDSQSRNQDFTRVGNDILHAIARQAANLLENLRLIEMERQSALLRKELQIAASIQSQIIPEKLPEFAFARIAGRSIPCTGVGGDFYDVIPVKNGFVAIVADVSGKGVPAALLASMVQGMFHAQTRLGVDRGITLLDSIESLNTFVCSRTPIERYVTLAAFRYLPSESNTVEIELINAGHVPPVIVRASGEVEVIEEGDMPVGLFEFAQYHVISLSLAIGDRIVLLTDGITEAETEAGEQFGVERLREPMLESDPVSSLLKAVQEFCQGAPAQDDRTILAIERIA